jgi:hypothetical protein
MLPRRGGATRPVPDCANGSVAAMNTWFDYRTVWAGHPWILAYAIIVVAVLLLSIVGTAVGGGPLAILFIPALAGAYAHHLMVMKRIDR